MENGKVIWTNCNSDEMFTREDYREWLEETDHTQEEIETLMNDDSFYDWAWDCCEMEFDDIYCPLKSISAPYGIMVTGSIGRWNGTSSGRSIITGDASNCMNCFITEDCEYHTYYVDENGDFCYEGHHHDGTNKCTFRIITDEDLESKMDYDEASLKDINNGTRRMGEDVLRALGRD